MAYARFFEEDRPISWAQCRPIIEIVALIAVIIIWFIGRAAAAR
jgi:hypothetical protein